VRQGAGFWQWLFNGSVAAPYVPYNLLINANYDITAQFIGIKMITTLFSINSTSILVNDTISVDASNSWAMLGIQFYQWHWDDGAADSYVYSPVTTHTYSATGVYNVTLTIWDNADYGDSTTYYSVVVSDAPTSFVVWLSTGGLLTGVSLLGVMLVRRRRN
jgi:PKD repeat protein